MLWYSDIISYSLYGSAMTGLVYFHAGMGALPKGHYKILELENVKVEKEEDYDSTRYHILPNDKIDLSTLNANEMDILDQVINKFRNYSASEMVEYMHKERAYLETKEGQEIPFSLAKEIKPFCLL